MTKRVWHRLAVAALISVAASGSAATADIVKARIAGYREVGAAFKAINDGLRGSEIQTILIAQSAREIRNASRAQYGWFPAGSDARAGEKTAAKPEIWAKPALFKAAQDGFAKQADLFQKTVAGGKPALIKAEARKLGEACKACHTNFRVPKE